MTTSGILRPALLGLACGALSTAALGASMTYNVDSNHTYPSFEADHLGGLSVWRGKVNSTSGTITFDKAMGAGSVDVTMDMTTIDFGHQGLNDHANTPDIFDTAQFPTATYTGRLANFQDGAPTAVEGTLTLHGVSKPVNLTVNSFDCKEVRGREVCGADAETTIDRSEFGVSIGQGMFNMGVKLRIQVEAAIAEE